MFMPVIRNLIRLPEFQNLELLHCQKLTALKAVSTDYCVLVNDGDSLPYETEVITDLCVAAMNRDDTDICYTDVLKSGKDKLGFDNTEYVPLCRQGLGLVLNQFAVMRTSAMLKVLENIPKGLYWTEALLFKYLEVKGISYVNKAGCLFDSDSNVSRDSKRSLAQTNSFVYYINHFIKYGD
jgi:hypothetical protein